MSNGKLALVLGAGGGVGFEAAKALLAHGWRVRALARRPDPALLPGAEWVQGDAMNRDDVVGAGAGVALIVHAVNPPGYRNWAKLVLPMIENTIAAAEAAGARIVLPGTIYNYGLHALPKLSEDAPQRPHTRKGKIRVELEQKLEGASARGVKSLVLRCGDFFGPHTTGNSWFAQLVTAGAPVKSVAYPGKRAVGHAWAYLPDVGETIARLADREAELPAFARFHFRGHYFARGVDIAKRIRDVAGYPGAPIKRFPWTPLLVLSPFVSLFRELAEMRYLWTHDAELDNARLVAFLGREPHTPTDYALGDTLRAMGCLACVLPSTARASRSVRRGEAFNGEGSAA